MHSTVSIYVEKLERRKEKIEKSGVFQNTQRLDMFYKLLNEFGKKYKPMYCCAVIDKFIDRDTSCNDIGSFAYMYSIQLWNDFIVRQYMKIRKRVKNREMITREERIWEMEILGFALSGEFTY
jgi:hypothetical protein